MPVAVSRAALPRHVPHGVHPVLRELLALRRYGGAMRSALALDDRQQERTRAAARSHGMEYAESRPYSPGDDVRRIDWRVTARTGRAHTKIFRTERSRDLFCLVDQRRSMHFGTRSAFKSVVAAQVAALAGWAAAAGGDRFGALVCGASTTGVPTGPAEPSTEALCATLAAEKARGDAPEVEIPLDALAARAAAEATAGTRFLVVSDFADPEVAFAGAMRILRARGVVVLLWVLDPMEETLPPPGRYPLTDGRVHMMLDTAAGSVRASHGRDLAERRERIARCAGDPAIHCRLVRTGEPLFPALERRLASIRQA